MLLCALRCLYVYEEDVRPLYQITCFPVERNISQVDV